MAKTGCRIDDLIDYNNAISCFYGRAAAGKTTLCLMAAANEKGKVVFIDTENSFSAERIKQIAGKVPGNIVVMKAKSFYEQCMAAEQLLELKGKISLIIVDSLTAHYRQELQEKRDANPFFSRHMSVLKELAAYAPVLVTSQVYSNEKGINPVGSNMLRNWCNNVIKLDDDGKQRKLFIEKSSKGNTAEICFEIVGDGITEI